MAVVGSQNLFRGSDLCPGRARTRPAHPTGTVVSYATLWFTQFTFDIAFVWDPYPYSLYCMCDMWSAVGVGSWFYKSSTCKFLSSDSADMSFLTSGCDSNSSESICLQQLGIWDCVSGVWRALRLEVNGLLINWDQMEAFDITEQGKMVVMVREMPVPIDTNNNSWQQQQSEQKFTRRILCFEVSLQASLVSAPYSMFRPTQINAHTMRDGWW